MTDPEALAVARRVWREAKAAYDNAPASRLGYQDHSENAAIQSIAAALRAKANQETNDGGS